jgi:hypothetical protein
VKTPFGKANVVGKLLFMPPLVVVFDDVWVADGDVGVGGVRRPVVRVGSSCVGSSPIKKIPL